MRWDAVPAWAGCAFHPRHRSGHPGHDNRYTSKMDALRNYVDDYLQRTDPNQRLEHQGLAFLVLGGACILVVLALILR
ncbi:MAG: hypothetical protein JWM61_648 [Micrococcaceae bacterium]|nr:hypothetical protein [Micrococcaceae bacterium]